MAGADQACTPRRLVVIGAGIAGLAAARAAAETARASGLALEVVVLERERVVGGKARTVKQGGWLLEGGPTGYLDNESAMDALVAAAGVEKLPADAAAARRFVVRDGRMRELHAHPLKLATSGVLSPLGLLRAATEPWRKRGPSLARGAAPEAADDESVWDFARRRLGREAADRLIGPMVLGVFAGDAKRTSLPAAFPRMAELEAEHGSLIRGMLALKRARKAAPTANAGPAGGPSGPAGTLTSFAGGMHTLPAGLAAAGEASGDFSVECGVTVTGLEHVGAASNDDSNVGPSAVSNTAGTWRIHTEGPAGHTDTLHADAVLIASECFAAADLLGTLAASASTQQHAQAIATELAAIPTPPVVVVGLGFGRAALEAAPRGFGALIQRAADPHAAGPRPEAPRAGGPRTAALRTLGVLWDTHLFPGRSPDGTLLMRCMRGGAVDPTAADLTDAELIAETTAELAQLFGLSGEDARPTFTEVVRWPRAIPQYELGHLARVARVRTHLAALATEAPGLHLAGNYLDGVAFTKAAKSGTEAGERAARALCTAPR